MRSRWTHASMLIVPCSSPSLLFVSQCSCCYSYCCWWFDGLVGDFSAQAVINTILHKSFPEDPIVGEEDSKDLRGEEGRQMREKVLELANSGLDQALTEELVRSISFTWIAMDALRFFFLGSTEQGLAVWKAKGDHALEWLERAEMGNCGWPSFLSPWKRREALTWSDRTVFFFFLLYLLRWRFLSKWEKGGEKKILRYSPLETILPPESYCHHFSRPWWALLLTLVGGF